MNPVNDSGEDKQGNGFACIDTNNTPPSLVGNLYHQVEIADFRDPVHGNQAGGVSSVDKLHGDTAGDRDNEVIAEAGKSTEKSQ